MMADFPSPVALAAGAKEVDPVEDLTTYVNDKWLQQLVPLRTQCFRCRKDSPVVHVPYGRIAFGGPVGRHDRDVTDAVIEAFAAIGWRFQKRKSYCDSCKGLGSV